MKRQAFQRGEIRDEDDNIIRTGAYGKNTAFATKDNKGILDYIINNFDALIDLITGVSIYADSKSEFPSTGVIGKRYIARDTGKIYTWDEEKSSYLELTEENKEYLTKDEADRIYAAQTALNSYLPLTGGTITGSLDLVSPAAKDKKIGITVNSKWFDVGYNWDNADGGGFSLRSNAYSASADGGPGGFVFYARNATNTTNLIGYADGRLTWGKKNLVRSINGVKADNDGNVTLEEIGSSGSYTLPTASATVLGGIKVGSGLSISDGVLNSQFNSADYMKTTDLRNNFLGKTETAVRATKANQDDKGNYIPSTYIKSASIKDNIITFTKGDGATFPITLPNTSYTSLMNSATVLEGMITMYAGDTAPTGWLVCDGSEVSKTTYASLYEIVGDAYGTPTDTGNFLLPNLSKLAGVMYIIKAIPTSDGVQVTI